ncbi:MAG: hypothetical protein ACLGXA_24000 [Acidobacteriota bacterium]
MISVLLWAALGGQTLANPDLYAQLRLYDGAWTVTMHDASGKARSDLLVNACHAFDRYFACQQSVNGNVGALVVYIPESTPGHFHTQNVLPDGRALGPGELTIEGSRWTYLSHHEENGTTTWYRTTNDFSGNNRIHFESAQSADQKTWTVTMSGDDVRGMPSSK